MDKRPACGPYITRGMRRRRERELPLDKRPPKNTLGQFMVGVQNKTPDAKVTQKGYRGGARMLYQFERIGQRLVAALRHPTKRATKGRTMFVTVDP